MSFIVAPLRKLIQQNPIVRLFIAGYFSCVVVGFALLQLPFCQNGFTSEIDALFTAASAVSTTGLATVDIGKTFSFSGQLVLLLLMQLGGIGYLIFSSYISLCLKKKEVFTVVTLIKQVITYTLTCEILGMTILYFFFQLEGVENSIWKGIFHSISAFCTAGFSLFSSNLEGYKHHTGINVTLSLLSLFGAFGFFLGRDFVKKMTKQIEHIKITARIVSAFASVAILIAILLFLATTTFHAEYSKFQAIIISAFHVMTTITTAGFNTVDMSRLPQITNYILIILMLLGVSITGSGTNMKGTSFPTLLKLIKNMLGSKSGAFLWSQKALVKRTQIATATFTHYLFVLLILGCLLTLTEKQSFLPLLFETASALCTVGLSMGITAELSTFGKSLIILLMLVGRTGILISGFAISLQKSPSERPKEPVLT